MTVTDQRRFDVRGQPSVQVIAESQGGVKDFLELIARSRRGLIEVPSQASALRLTALIYRLFPCARIYIPVATKKQVRWVRTQLQSALGARVDVWEEYEWPWEGGRLVCTLRTFDCHNDCDFEVVLSLDCFKATLSSHGEAFLRLTHQRMYGFLRAGQMLSRKTHLYLQALFGPVLHRVPDQRGRKDPVQVHWCLPPEFRLAHEQSALERKRCCYWNNDRRNDLIAAVVSAFRAGYTQRLWEFGLLLAEDESALQSLGTPSVAILVESVEHGRQLCRRLDGWHLWRAGPQPPTPLTLPPGVESIWGLGILNRVILTLTEASRLESIYTDVLIVASSDGWPDTVRGFPPRTWRTDHQMLLVDLADDFDERARQATVRRQRDYAGRGWFISGVPAWFDQMT